MERSYNVLSPGGSYVNALVMEIPQEEPQRRGIRSMGLASGQTPAFCGHGAAD